MEAPNQETYDAQFLTMVVGEIEVVAIIRPNKIVWRYHKWTCDGNDMSELSISQLVFEYFHNRVSS